MDASRIGPGAIPDPAESSRVREPDAAGTSAHADNLAPALRVLKLIGQSGSTNESATDRVVFVSTGRSAQSSASRHRVADLIDDWRKKVNLYCALGHPTLRAAERLPDGLVDVMLTQSPHELFLHDNQFPRWGLSWDRPAIVIDIDRPNSHGFQRAQTVADITGSYVLTPRPEAPAEWATLTPRRINTGLDGPVDFDPQDNAFYVTLADRSRSPIDPHAHLGMLLGTGRRKTALQLGDKTVVIYRDEMSKAMLREIGDSPERASALTEQLRLLGAPHLAKIHGITRIHGLPALVMDTYLASSEALEAMPALGGPSGIDVYDTSLLTHRSIASLSATRKWMVEGNVVIDDLQFLVRRDGTFDLADPEAVVPGGPPNPSSLKTIDRLLWLAHAKLAR